MLQSKRETSQKRKVLWAGEGDDAGGGLTLMGSGVPTLQLNIDSNARRLNNNLSHRARSARHMLPLQRTLVIPCAIPCADSRKLVS